MFVLNKNTKIYSEITSKPVENAIRILERDFATVFTDTEEEGGRVVLKEAEGEPGEEQFHAEEEQFLLEVAEQMTITAKDELGFVYGLLYVSEHFLGIKPFWFFMDQQMDVRERLEIPEQTYVSVKPAVRFRGWFFNDEVLMMKWKCNENSDYGWRMAFEALLRCGGNMAIPGTDKMAGKNRQLAADMGLWITHHHAEPLGAEMFVRAYPDKEPNYLEHSELFEKLWEEAVIAQKDCRVVWNLCFRGQGDAPFWSYDTTGKFDTPKKRGELISSLIRRQSEIVKKHIKEPIFCTNLYGEIMELYEQGFLDLDEDIIKVRADNGFGKMVTRRRDNHSGRVSSMPDKHDTGAQGIYYHVSFYDLQAANHITMLPNSVAFVDKELSEVLKNGGDDFWVINCSNVRPHTYFLDAVRKKWFGRTIDDDTHSREFAEDYFAGNAQTAQCYQAYPDAMIPYGENEDEHAGEQYYTENIRILSHQFLVDKEHGAKQLFWLTGDVPLREQIAKVCSRCREGLTKLERLYRQCRETEETLGSHRQLFSATLFLQVKIHYFCARGTALFMDAYREYEAADYEKAFVLFGNAAESFDSAEREMRAAEYGVWENFYFNDCFADVKHTAYMIRKVMAYIRELGDNARHDKWYRKYCYAKEDRDVYLLLVTDNHMEDWALYEAMRDHGRFYAGRQENDI